MPEDGLGAAEPPPPPAATPRVSTSATPRASAEGRPGYRGRDGPEGIRSRRSTEYHWAPE